MKKPAAAFDDLDQEGNAAPTGRRKSSDRGDSAGASWDGFDEELMRVRPSRESTELLANLSNKELMDYTGVHFTTVYRWRRQQKLPGHIEKLLKFVALKELDQFEGWEGWKIINRTLISPSGGNYNTGNVDAIQIRKQQLAFLEADRRKWKNTLDQPAIADDTDKFLKQMSDELLNRIHKPKVKGD